MSRILVTLGSASFMVVVTSFFALLISTMHIIIGSTAIFSKVARNTLCNKGLLSFFASHFHLTSMTRAPAAMVQYTDADSL